MKELKKRSTTIHEDVRRMLGISRDGYAFCAYVHYRCADSRQKKSGWCCDNKQDVADFVGMTRRGLFKMAERFQEIGLIEISNSGDYRTTPKWIDAESKRELSSQKQESKNGNLVPKRRELSSQKNSKIGNLVHNDTLYIELENKIEGERGEKTPPPASYDEMMERVNAETLAVEAKKEKAPPIAPAPPSIYNGYDFDVYSKVPLTDMLEDDPGLLVSGFDAATLPGAIIRTAEIMPTNPTAAAILHATGRAPMADDSEGAQKLIMAWATNGALETVQNWYNLARRKFTPEDLELVTAKFCGTYSTISDAGRRLLFFADPVQFFRNKGRVFIQDQKSFDRMNEPKNGFAQPETKYTPPPSSEKIPAYTP